MSRELRNDEIGDMKVSVITVCRNAESTIERTIKSFLEQDYKEKEMLIIDGASTDRTVNIASKYAGSAVRVISEPDRGMYDALNKGLNLFTGDALGVLNADDSYHDPQVLSRVVDGLKNCDAVHGHLDFKNVAGEVIRRWRATPPPSKGFASGWMPAHPTFYVRRPVVLEVGEFDLTLPTAADYDWMLRALHVHSAQLNLIPHVMIDMAMGGRSTASISAYIRHNLEALRARRRWLNSGIVDWALIAKPASKLSQFK